MNTETLFCRFCFLFDFGCETDRFMADYMPKELKNVKSLLYACVVVLGVIFIAIKAKEIKKKVRSTDSF
jgi:hypothetical protein